MADPRNIAHDKTVALDKEKKHEPIVDDAAETPQPGKKTALKHHASDQKPAEADSNDE